MPEILTCFNESKPPTELMATLEINSPGADVMVRKLFPVPKDPAYVKVEVVPSFISAVTLVAPESDLAATEGFKMMSPKDKPPASEIVMLLIRPSVAVKLA